MSERYDRLAREREEIAARVADFKATQEKFKREREEYFTTTLKNGRDGQGSRHALGLYAGLAIGSLRTEKPGDRSGLFFSQAGRIYL